MRGACKVCNSPYMNDYEKEWYDKKGQITYTQLEEIARTKGEDIGRKSFQNHFDTHYKPERIQELLDKGSIDSEVDKSKLEAINILDEIKRNLIGLKALTVQAKGTKNVGDLVAAYRELRLTLQDIETMRTKLSASTSLTKAELYREIYWACAELCPQCRETFWVKLDERLKKKGFS